MNSNFSHIQIDGQGEHTIIMLHGWPDTGALWDKQVADLQSDYRCVRLTLPGFAAGDTSRPLSIAEVVSWLDQSICAVTNRPVILMVHDWGAVFGYAYARSHPERVERLIAMDIGDTSEAFSRSLSFKHKLMILGYQLPLAVSYRLPRCIATPITRAVAKYIRSPAAPDTIHAGMNFPYYQAWFGGKTRYVSRGEFLPHCPMLFIYGKRKPFQFFANSWIEKIAALPRCQVTPMRAGHWMTLDAPQEFNAIVRQWLVQTESTNP